MERANTKHRPIFDIFTILDSGEYVEPGKHRSEMNFQHFYIWHTLTFLYVVYNLKLESVLGLRAFGVS